MKGKPAEKTPYWANSASLPSFPSLNRDIEVDVAVIGGGITGITAAYLLKKSGRTVALIERERCASIDTGHTTAHLTCVTDKRLRDLVKQFGRDHAKAAWEAGLAAIDQIFHNIRAEKIKCEFTWVPGYLHSPLKGGTESKDAFKEEAQIANELGFSAEFLAKVPFVDRCGIKFLNQAKFHPRKYLAGLLKVIAGDGSYVFENTASETVEERPLRVKAGGHKIRCGYVVIATHNPLLGKASMVGATLLQTKLALYSSYAVGAKLPKDVVPEALFWDTDDPYYFLRIDQHKDHDYAIFGGEDHKTGQAADTEEVYAKLERALLDIMPGAAVDHHWSGQVIETNDGLPLMGEMAENQFAATGYGGNGMTFGTLGGMMACDAVLKRQNPWSDLFDIHRKKLRGGTWSYLVENKDYPYYFVRDRLAKAEADSLDAVMAGEGRIVKLNGEKVAAYRNEKGALALCSPVCTHMKCIVAWNNAEKTWDCPCHGSRFKPTGEIISGPAEEPLEKVPLPANQV